jgi:phospholipase C
MAALDGIDTLVILMFENRSFDHLLGHLSLEEPRMEVEGLRDPETNQKYVNDFLGQAFRPFLIQDEAAVINHDPPHSRASVRTQMHKVRNRFRMSGFVKAYFERAQSSVGPQAVPMGYVGSQTAWMSSFLARNFCVCDHWFTPLPADTQPNRLMAFTGHTLIDETQGRLLKHTRQDLVFEWLNRHQIPWRVYHDGLPSFALYGRVEELLGPNFRSIDRLETDIRTEPAAKAPKVLFIEPRYFDNFLSDKPANCNHPTARLCHGELFLHRVYSALTSNPEKWARTLFIVTYDEHGGFFDHVPPLRIISPVPPGADYTEAFSTTGPRVPALLVSPRFKPGKVFSGPLDHTSMLQLIAEMFGSGPEDYSTFVTARRKQGISSVSAALEGETSQRPAPQRAPVPCPPPPARPRPPRMPNELAFKEAAQKLKREGGGAAVEQFPSLARLPP